MTFWVLIFDVTRVFHVLVKKYTADLESMRKLLLIIIANEVTA